jgi:CRISPR system Cascade subunit CasB
LLGAEPQSLPAMLRQAISLLAADGHACDFVKLLDDLARWLNPYAVEQRERLCQQWARDFYRAYDKGGAQVDDTPADTQLDV